VRAYCPSPRRRRAPAERRTRLRRTALPAALAPCLAALLSACSLFAARAPAPAPAPTTPELPEPANAQGAAIAAFAASLIGTRYEFGGADQGGFDCSGLALYVYERVGISIPRTAAAQQRAALPVPLAQLAPGDLLFFRLRGHRIDHVGVYAGTGRFIHAPHSGVAVASADLSDAYFSRHFAAAGRFGGGALSSP
jgi:cell wall-associated NlpC family hydrolase